MNYKEYGDNRWEIVYGSYEGAQRRAVNRLYGMVQQFVPYVLTVSKAAEALPECKNLILIGTLNNHPVLRRLNENKFYTAEGRSEGYSIFAGEEFEGKNIIILQGADDAGVLYAAEDFGRYYINHLCKYHGYHYNGRFKPFIDEVIPYKRISAPSIEFRGLWSWGHVVYDYRRYIDNMSACKLNTLVLWNDYAPINMEDIIMYAHSRAIKVIWGFSWCWGQPVNPKSPDDLEKWTSFVMDALENQYRPDQIDGIYFQAFTETSDTEIGGAPIAAMAARWVRDISEKVYEKYPGLWIQFGIHATSIKDAWESFQAIDPRMSIVWEDAGSFPYNYNPAEIEGFEETLAYTKRLCGLRGKKERFGAVLKGFTVLNWTEFEHQQGEHVVGEAPETWMDSRREEKQFYWDYAAPYWINQAGQLQEILGAIAASGAKDRCVTVLAEDGMWECGIHVSVELLAELLWDPAADIKDLLEVCFHGGNQI